MGCLFLTAVLNDLAPARPETGFADLGLPDDLLSAVTDLGFTTPTGIQTEAIPLLLAGRDVVGVAQTGTGKTAAFGLPLLAAVDPKLRAVQALVLAPTRELALQVSDAIATFASHQRGLTVLPIYGGSSFTPQLRGLRDGAQVVVGTPGRVMDLMEKGSLDLSNVRFLVLDEADEMLRMGFAEDVEQIAARVPAGRRTALFSATMPAAIKRVAATHLTDPVRVSVTPASSTVSNIEQTYAVVPFRHKTGALARVLAISDADAAIVFVRTKSAADEVAIELAGRGIQAAAISGDVAQKDREKLIDRLRSGTLDVLVATDVAARGLDVERIGLVVNFDVPRETETYVHRIGRTGRAGRSGRALTFLTPRERGQLSQIERATGSRLQEAVIPSPADVSAHRASSMLAKVGDRLAAGRLDLYREILDGSEHDLREMAAALLAIAVGDDGPAPREERSVEDAGPRQRREERYDSSGEFVGATFEEGRDNSHRHTGPRTGRAGTRSRHRDGSGTRYRVEVGHRDGVQAGAIVGAITGEGGLRGQDLGKIDIFPSFSLVEISQELSPETSRRIAAARVAGRPLKIRPDTGPGPRKPRR
ncbi:ATP-dependent RNA helicase DeaD [Georgenia satyanarayanai]|uniref:RNA helicase n=1 Tax=Georgenia satyanarayanai TaxID=860221 RepID=A0A2Y9A3W7_9MICO|nr:ATP-dependent RNA helicase DeaD [Georgenia satyanarayanai]SSA36907.1 ATP-dependent RNA helicase DeaD [Georgenia satyanarayanai]